jgi:hypothetical protein
VWVLETKGSGAARKGVARLWNVFKKQVLYIPGIAVANDLDLDALAKDGLEDVLNKILVHPALHLAHPV